MRKIIGKQLTLGAALVCINGTAIAQATLDEILVTARKQTDKLSELPDSITIISEDMIETAGISNVEDFLQMTPNVVAMQGLKPGFVTITSRGITTIQENEAPMAVVIDGVVVPAIDFINQDLFDIQQIEVLRGPQGSLYGANALAGAINITTKAPTNEFRGKLKAGLGNAGYGQVAGVFSGPLVENELYFRAAANYRDEDGTLKNIYDGGKVDFYEEFGLRGQLRWDVSDSLQVELRGKYIDTTAGAVYNATTDAAIPGQINDFNNVKMDYNTPGEDTRELQDYSLKIDWSLANGGSLTFISGYGVTEDDVIGEGDWLPTTATHIDASGLSGFLFDTFQNWAVETEAFSQEIRYNSASDQRVRYNIGAFYQKRERDIALLVGGGSDGIVDPGLAFINDKDNSDSEQRAVFGQASIDLTEQLELTLGLRYDEDERSSVSDVAGGPAPVEDTFSKLQPKVSLAYQWDEDLLTYMTLARAFRSGGFNADDTLVGGTLFPRRYEAEVADSFELGFKAMLAEKRLRIHGAVFHIDYENQQFFFPTLQGQILTNFPETKIDGAELEVFGNLTDNLTITTSYGVSNAKVEAADEQGSFKGNHSPQVNEYTFNTGVEYTQPLTDLLDLTLRVDYERRGPIYWNVENTLRTPEKDYMNLYLVLKSGSWSLNAFAKNVTNERQPVEVLENFPGILDAHARRPNLERRYGVSVEYQF